MAFQAMKSGWAKALVGAVVCAIGAGAQAAIIPYGNFVGADLSFLGVTESSGTDPVPLFDTPHVVTNTLNFDPKGFVSFASNGSADVTDGQLNFEIVAHAGKAITGLSISEDSGDFALAGVGTTATTVNAGVVVFVKITEINNVPLAANEVISLPAYSSNFSANLITSPGVSQTWSLNTPFIDIAAALGPDQEATRIQVVLNNTLVTTSENGTLAFIAKKEFVVDAQATDSAVPEPAALGLLAVAGVAMLRRRRIQ